MADNDPAFVEKTLYISKRKRETSVQYYIETNDLSEYVPKKTPPLLKGIGLGAAKTGIKLLPGILRALRSPQAADQGIGGRCFLFFGSS